MKVKAVMLQRLLNIPNKLCLCLFAYDFGGVRRHLIMISNTSDLLYNPTVMRLYNFLSAFHLTRKLGQVDFPEVDTVSSASQFRLT